MHKYTQRYLRKHWSLQISQENVNYPINGTTIIDFFPTPASKSILHRKKKFVFFFFTKITMLKEHINFCEFEIWKDSPILNEQ